MTTAALYERMWQHDAYRQVAPGEHLAYRFVELAKPDERVIDFGSGTGRGAALIHAFANVPVLALDFAANSMDEDVRRIDGIEFRRHDLREPVGEFAEHGYCTDVLEHIAPEDVDRVLRNVLTAARKVFLAISTVPDHFGPAVAGEPLHLTVQPAEWWLCKLADDFHCRVLWAHDAGNAVLLYVSAYADGADVVKKSGMNATDERLRENIRRNLELALNEVAPHEPQPDLVVRLLAGGPSLADFEEEIIEAGRRGEPIVTVNGTYNWLIERGVVPAAQIVVDAREFNRRFVERTFPQTRYLVSSQCAHELVSALPREQTLLFHSGENEINSEVFKDFCEARGIVKEWFPVYGGSTVITRGLVLLAMLGFRKIEVFGWDSCLRDDRHHAYAQPENDGAPVLDVRVGGRTFRCNPWMAVQAYEVPHLIKNILGHIDGFELEVRGDGLIAHMIQHAASMAEKE